MAEELYGKKMTAVGPVGARTNIDRRNCTRIVPMKVLCFGLGRTGTSSMRTALIQLGFVDCYHMFSVMEENPKDADMWAQAFQAKFEGKGKGYRREEWDKLLGHCMAVTDYPSACFVDELLAAYPDAKVILTVRDNVDVWHKSVTDTIWGGQVLFGVPKNAFQAFLKWLIPKPPGFKVLYFIYKYTFLSNHPEEGRQAYLDHNEHVRAVAPTDRFLQFNVKEGWAPLCEFLEVPMPDTPFPRVNETATFREFIAKSKKEAAMKLLVPVGTWAASLGIIGTAIWAARGR